MKNRASKYINSLFDNLIWVLVVIALFLFSALSESFRAPSNLAILIYRQAPLGLLVIGQAFTMLTGNFDLSSESGFGLTAMVAGLLMASVTFGGLGWEVSPVIAILVMIVVGLLIGFINGFLVTRLRMNNLIVTIAMMLILRGLVYVISPGATTSFFPDSFNWLGAGVLVRIPHESGIITIHVATVFVLLCFIISHIVTRYTQFGRNMYATGANPIAAQDSGIQVKKIIRQVYLISGFCMAIAGLLAAGRANAATPRLGFGLIFSIQAAAVIGGVSLFGGRGSMIGAMGGLFLWSILDAGLSIMQVSPFWIETSRGLLLLFAIGLDALKVRSQERQVLMETLAETTIGLKDVESHSHVESF